MREVLPEERKKQADRLQSETQEEVMADIIQFHELESHCYAPKKEKVPDALGILVFNMERGVHIDEIIDVLHDCPDVQPWDVILANELDDGCFRSGNKNTAKELAERFGLNYAWGLEFIELTDERNKKGFHGNAVFSKWPITASGVIRLPEQYNWYFDRQKRIGGRLAVWAMLDVGGRSVGVVSIHLENRTDSHGRKLQMETIISAVKDVFPPDVPVVMGGDLNTNTFDGRDKDVIQKIAGDGLLTKRCLEETVQYEEVLSLLQCDGFSLFPDEPICTRRKPMPDGSFLPLRLDWIMTKGVTAEACRVISTAKESFTYAKPGSALEQFTGAELSDHNAVWTRCTW